MDNPLDDETSFRQQPLESAVTEEAQMLAIDVEVSIERERGECGALDRAVIGRGQREMSAWAQDVGGSL